MNFKELQEFFYPLGWISTFFFTWRMLWQWLRSEKEGTSVVFPAFWWISLFGNLTLALHTALQLQFVVCLTQSCQIVLSWRNLEFSGSRAFLGSWQRTLLVTILTSVSVSLFFLWIGWKRNDWILMRAPQLFSKNSSVPFMYHLIGSLGVILFSLRFWVQWILSEKLQSTKLPPLFWFASLIGALLSSLYFFLLGDPINLIGPLFGSITYFRNIMLFQFSRKPL